jgi:hypothetical protein
VGKGGRFKDGGWLWEWLSVYWCPTRFPYQMMFVSPYSNRTGVTCEAGTANHSGAHVFIPVFSGVRLTRSLVFYVKFCRSLFVLFAIMFYILLRFATSNYPFGNCSIPNNLLAMNCTLLCYKMLYCVYFLGSTT